MQVINNIEEIRSFTRNCRSFSQEVGFVPTMGYLHQGHLSLMEQSLDANDCTVVSIYVNPSQFLEGEDFDTYPRDLDRDLEKCEMLGINAVFIPNDTEMYPGRCLTSVSVSELTDRLCGMSRGRAHFTGVCTIVCKLFNIVQPDRAYFGQKDAQQAVIVGRMVHDLNLPVKLKVCPTVREEAGLALSSRNSYLTSQEREQALCLYHALCSARQMLRAGEKTSMLLLEAMTEVIDKATGVEIDYLEILEPDELHEVAFIDDIVLIAGAININKIHLIDNLLLHPKDGPWES